MGFFSKLLGKGDWKETLIKDLAILIAVDGNMDKKEVSLACEIAINKLGFTEQKFIDLMGNLDKIKDIYPIKREDKLDYIKYLLQIIYADGIVDDNEITYIKKIVERMHLPSDTIDIVISYIKQSINEVEDNFKGSSTNKIIITSPIEPIVELQSEEGIKSYFSKISQLSNSDLCIELSNVMAAKHNYMIIPTEINKFQEKQQVITDLVDKAVAICILKFGQSVVFGYEKGDLQSFNKLINIIDEEVALLNLNPMEHGCTLIKKLIKKLN